MTIESIVHRWGCCPDVDARDTALQAGLQWPGFRWDRVASPSFPTRSDQFLDDMAISAPNKTTGQRQRSYGFATAYNEIRCPSVTPLASYIYPNNDLLRLKETTLVARCYAVLSCLTVHYHIGTESDCVSAVQQQCLSSP